MSYTPNPIQAPARTRMAMPAHLEAMVGAPSRGAVSKFSREGRRQRQAELSQRIYELRTSEVAAMEAELEQRKLDDERQRKVRKLLAAASELLDADRDYTRHPMRMRRLLSILAKEYGMPIHAILSDSRKNELCEARHVYFWIAHRNLHGRASISAIGRFIGNRDHTTVLHGLKKVGRTPALRRRAEIMEGIVLEREKELYGG